jgi:NAD(P)-dependent dehydrogenase (short-subunit alcohol dehydrogenase family)
MIVDLIDAVLDRSVALGYGRPGLWARRRLPGWPGDNPRLDGKSVLVTGAASGIGLAASRAFAQLGARVLAVARTSARAQQAVDEIRATVPQAELRALACDVSDLGALRGLATTLTESEPRLDVLVNNAGVMPSDRQRSADGHELAFATHVLAPFALTAWVRPLLERSAPARVINVSSGGMYTQSIPCHDLESDQDHYRPARIYAVTKREEVVITELWAERLRGTGITVHAMHPGWVDTKGVKDSLPGFRKLTRPIIRTPEQGADTIVWLGASPEALVSTGKFWHDRRPRPTRYLLGAGAEPDSCRNELWEYCESSLKGVA